MFQELFPMLYFGRLKVKTQIFSGKENNCLVGKYRKMGESGS